MSLGNSPTTGTILGQQQPEQVLASRVKSGASWFLWIAILSIINSIIARFEGNVSFVVGLGITQMIDGVANASGSGMEGGLGGTALVAFVLDILVAGMFVLFYRLTMKGSVGAFITGMVLYALDGLLFVMVKEYLSIGFHAFALYRIFTGFRAAQEMQRLATSGEIVPR